MDLILVFLSLFFFSNCNNSNDKINESIKDSVVAFSYIIPEGATIEERFPAPPGFERKAYDSLTFAYYLCKLPLKPDGSQVHLYNGSLKGNQNAHVAVIDLDAGTVDLQQCADAVIRLRAEYLFSVKQYDKISFHFTNGYDFPWIKYSQGYRVEFNGNKTNCVRKSNPSDSYKDFRAYLNLIFTYAGTLSLSKELTATELSGIEPGNVFIVGGSPGHAVIVLDVVENSITGEKLFLLGQSYMPAQEIHVLRNPANSDDNPWYSNDITDNINTPEWVFDTDDLKRF